MTAFDVVQRLQLAGRANVLRGQMSKLNAQESMEVVKGILAKYDIVIGVWSDKEEPEGVALHVIKGENLLSEIAAAEKPNSIQIGVIPCNELKDAIAAAKLLGPTTH